MQPVFLFVLFTSLFCSCSSRAQEPEYLLRYEAGDQSGYKTPGGEIVVPAGKYAMCFTDTFRTYAVVKDPEGSYIAINREEKVLYQVLNHFSGPDKASDGMFRIRQNGKIGFADERTGVIRIAPKVTYAEAFRHGVAKVCDSCRKIPTTKGVRMAENQYEGNWYYIDQSGRRFAVTKGRTYTEAAIENHVAQLNRQFRSNKLKEVFYPNMSFCGGALNGYYECERLQFIVSDYGGGFGDKNTHMKIWFKDSSVVKVLISESTADLEAFAQRYPDKEAHEHPKLLTYIHNETTIWFTDPATIVQSPEATGVNVFGEEELKNLNDCIETMMIELRSAPAIADDIRRRE